MGSPESTVLREWERYAPWARLQVDDDQISAPVAGRHRRWVIAGWPATTAAAVGPHEVLVAATLGRRMRSLLARNGQSYADRDTLHLVDGDTIIHLERVGLLDEETDRPQRATPHFPPSGVRAVQTLLLAGDTEWTVRRLADQAELSVGQAQRILSILDVADLMTTHDKGGPRTIRNRGVLLDWLVQQPVALRAPVQWPVHVYGRSGRELIDRAVEGLLDAHCDFAVTGMAAAALVDLGPTSLTTVHIWIDRETDLEAVADVTGMKAAPRGANVILWSDADRSGTSSVEQIGRTPVAPGPRVYLDLLQLPRGREVADTYRRVHLGY